MKAVTVAPGRAGSVRLDNVPEPDAVMGSVLVETLAAGICGTDAEIAEGGSVNANRRHYYRAAKALAAADRSWLEKLLTRQVRPDEIQEAIAGEPDDIKVVVEFATP
jgi:glucose 1-dehydrogenase